MIKELWQRANYDFKFTAINQLWRLISGPIILIMIPMLLTGETQGYWFTMTSLAALAVFADFGFSNILLQFSAHEFAHLKFNNKLIVIGSEEHERRLATLFVFALKWALTLIAIAFPLIYITGYYVLSKNMTSICWQSPWVIYNIGAAFSFINSILLSFIEGCNSAGKIQKIRFTISFLTSIFMIAGLFAGLTLYSLGVSLILSSILGLGLITKIYGSLFLNLLKKSKGHCHSWRKEILPLFWRYAISWLCGYIMFQLFTPIMFHFHGPTDAGKIGISIALFTSIFSISNTWSTSITPKINILIANKDYKSLDPLFKKRLLLVMITFITGSLSILIFIISFKSSINLLSKFLNPIPMATLALCWFFQVIIHNLAIYLRSHKEEPLVVPTVVSALYISLTTLLCSLYLPTDYFFLGFLTSYFWLLPWVAAIYLKKKAYCQNSI